MERDDHAVVLTQPLRETEQAHEPRLVLGLARGRHLREDAQGVSGVAVPLVDVGEEPARVATAREAASHRFERHDLPLGIPERIVDGGQSEPGLRIGRVVAQLLHEGLARLGILAPREVGPPEVGS